MLLIAAVLTRQVEGLGPAAYFQMTILHTNDLHSHDESFKERERTVGGLARIGHLIRLIRKQEPNTVVVDAGDIFQGTPIFTRYKGAVEVHLLNQIGYDIFTIGNHEFDDGVDNLANQLKEAQFKIISANLDCSKSPSLEKLVRPSLVKEIGGQKVGFVGCVTPELESLALNLSPLALKQKGAFWYQPIKQEIEKLESEGINKIIVVSHSGLDKDRELAANIPEIDAIVGGHSHTRMDKPELFQHPGIGTTIVVQTGSYGRALGKLHLVFDKDGKLVFPQTDYHLINITDRIFEEADLKDYIAEKEQPLLGLRQEILGSAESDFENKWLNYQCDSPLGDLIADALYESGKKYGATIAFENRGGIRARIDKGPISAENVEEILPFDNRLTIGTISGDKLIKLLEHSLAGSLGGKFLDEHGLKLAYDPKGEPGHKLLFVLALTKAGLWQAVDPNSRYRVAINSYSFSGGEGYDFSQATDVQKLPDKMNEVMRDYLKKVQSHKAHSPDRICPISTTLLRPEKDGKRVKLHVQTEFENARIYLVAGDGLGVDSVTLKANATRAIPVPLSNPRIVRSENMRGTNTIDLEPPAPTELDQRAKKQLIAVIVEPIKGSKNGSKGKIQVSAPVDLNDLNN
jgi:5'-nucleotidase